VLWGVHFPGVVVKNAKIVPSVNSGRLLPLFTEGTVPIGWLHCANNVMSVEVGYTMCLDTII